MNKGKITGNFFDRFDYFAEPVPSFNMEGSNRVGTSIGLISTIMMTIVVLCYTTVKLIICIGKTDVQVTTSRFTREVDQESAYNMKDFDF